MGKIQGWGVDPTCNKFPTKRKTLRVPGGVFPRNKDLRRSLNFCWNFDARFINLIQQKFPNNNSSGNMIHLASEEPLSISPICIPYFIPSVWLVFPLENSGHIFGNYSFHIFWLYTHDSLFLGIFRLAPKIFWLALWEYFDWLFKNIYSIFENLLVRSYACGVQFRGIYSLASWNPMIHSYSIGSQESMDWLLGIYWLALRNMSSSYQESIGQLSRIYWSTIKNLSISSREFIDCLPSNRGIQVGVSF